LTRRIASASALLVVVALAAACSSAPPSDAEKQGSSAEAITSCTWPFSHLTRVFTGHGTAYVCESLAGEPAAPPYPSHAMTSCPGGSLMTTPGVAPPSGSGCTYGMAVGSPVADQTIFLCPVSSGLPPPEPITAHCSSTFHWLGSPVDDGCFGDPVDSTWAYVFGDASACELPGNCGAQCAAGFRP
jgi:hypothetical protein